MGERKMRLFDLRCLPGCFANCFNAFNRAGFCQDTGSECLDGIEHGPERQQHHRRARKSCPRPRRAQQQCKGQRCRNFSAMKNDKQAEVRGAAAQALGEMGAKSAIAALHATYQDTDPSVIIAAAHSLVVLGDDSGYNVYYAVLTGEQKTGQSLSDQQKKMLKDPKKGWQLSGYRRRWVYTVRRPRHGRI